MKVILLIGSLLLGGIVTAQTVAYQPLHGNYTQYIYRSQHWNGTENVEGFKKTIWSGDVLFNGEHYTRIFQGGLYCGGVREDVANQQRYFLDANNVEHDITIGPFLQVGAMLTDSAVFLNAFRTYLFDYNFTNCDTLMVTAVDSILEGNGLYSASYHLECLSQPNTSFDFNTYRGLLKINGFEFSEDQICYREDGEQTPPGQETPWTPMCDLGIQENSLLEVSASPNPSKNFVELSGRDLSLIRELRICDVQGKEVKKILQAEVSTRISLEELESGVYLLAINGSTKIIRLIKQ